MTLEERVRARYGDEIVDEILEYEERELYDRGTTGDFIDVENIRLLQLLNEVALKMLDEMGD